MKEKVFEIKGVLGEPVKTSVDPRTNPKSFEKEEDIEEFLKTKLEVYAKKHGYEFRLTTNEDNFAQKGDYLLRDGGTHQMGNVFYLYGISKEWIR